MFQNLSQNLFIWNNLNNFLIYKKKRRVFLLMEIQNKTGDQECSRYGKDGQDQMQWNAVHWLQLNAEIWAWIVHSK